MTESPWPPDKTAMLADLQKGWTELQRALDGWDTAQMTDLRDPAGWSVKDHLTHLTVWEEGISAMLHKQSRYKAMGFDVPTMQSTSEDEINARIQRRHASQSLDEVRADLRRSHNELVAAIEALDAAEVLKGYAHFLPNEPDDDSGHPVLRWIVDNSSGHYRQHLPWMRAIAERP